MSWLLIAAVLSWVAGPIFHNLATGQLLPVAAPAECIQSDSLIQRSTVIARDSVVPVEHNSDAEDLPIEQDHPREFTGRPIDINLNQGLLARKKPFIWVHIHKSAGTLMCTLATLAGEKVVQPSNNCNWDPFDLFRASGLPEKNAPSCASRLEYFQKNGYTYGQIEREFLPSDHCWENFEYGAMLREPIKLIHSLLNYNLRKGSQQFDDGHGRQALAELRSRIESGANHTPGYHEWLALDNFQTRILTNSLAVPAGKLNKNHVAQAKQILAKFKGVAVLEDFANTSALLYHRMGWRADMAQYAEMRVNHAENTLKLSSSDVQWLQEVNRFDSDLYHSFKM